MSLLAARTAIVSAIDTAIPSLREVKAHDGRFDLAELKRWAAVAPCVRVAALAVPRFGMQGRQPYAVVRWGAFLVCAGAPATPLSRGAQALTYAAELMSLIPGRVWSLSGAQAPDGMSAQNLFSAEIDRHGVSLWAFQWTQQIDIALLSAAELEDLLTVHLDWDLAVADDAIDAEDDIELEPPP